MSRQRHSAKPALAAAASALGSALPYLSGRLFFLSWFSFAVFFRSLLKNADHTSAGRTLLRGWLFGFVYHAVGYCWFWWLYPMEYTGFSKPLALLMTAGEWLVLSLIHGFLFALGPLLFCLFHRYVTKNRLAGGLFLLCALLLAEKSMEYTELAFPWLRLAAGQYRLPALVQSASVIGAIGVDVLILTVNLLLALASLTKGRPRTLCLVLAAAIFSGNALFGAIRLAQPVDPSRTIRAAMVQDNVLFGRKRDEQFFQDCQDNLLSLTEEVSPQADIVIWPENALARNLDEFPDVAQTLRDVSVKLQRPLLVGVMTKNGENILNDLVMVTDGEFSNFYTKRRLTPFGERFPYRTVLEKLVPFLEKMNASGEYYEYGSGTELLHTDRGVIGGIICVESVFPGVVRDSVRDGAELIVMVTNDSYYLDSPLTTQHLAQDVLRCVENSRCSLRCAMAGISASIDSRGRITSALPALERGVLEAEAYFSDEMTFYTKYGEWLPQVMLALLAAATVCGVIAERKKSRGKPAK